MLLFGARQTGKTTLLRDRLPEGALVIDLLRRDEWLRYLRQPDALRGDVRAHLAAGREALVFIDEVQKSPTCSTPCTVSSKRPAHASG